MIVDISEVWTNRRSNLAAYQFPTTMSYKNVREGFPPRKPVETTMDQRTRYDAVCCYRTERRWTNRPAKADWAMWEKRLRQ